MALAHKNVGFFSSGFTPAVGQEAFCLCTYCGISFLEAKVAFFRVFTLEKTENDAKFVPKMVSGAFACKHCHFRSARLAVVNDVDQETGPGAYYQSLYQLPEEPFILKHMTTQDVPFPYEHYRSEEMPSLKSLCGFGSKDRRKLRQLWNNGTWRQKHIPWSERFQAFYKHHGGETYVTLSAVQLFPTQLLHGLTSGVVQQFLCLQNGQNLLKLCESIETRLPAIKKGVKRKRTVAKLNIDHENAKFVVNLGLRMDAMYEQTSTKVNEMIAMAEEIASMQARLCDGQATVSSRRTMVDRIEQWLPKRATSPSSWPRNVSVLYLPSLWRMEEQLESVFAPLLPEQSLNDRIAEVQQRLERVMASTDGEFVQEMAKMVAKRVEKLALVSKWLPTITREFQQALGVEFQQLFSAFFSSGKREEESVAYSRLIFRPLFLNESPIVLEESALNALRPAITGIHPVFGVKIPMRVISTEDVQELDMLRQEQSQPRMLHPVDTVGCDVYFPDLPQGFSLVTIACPLAIESLEIMKLLVSMDVIIRFDAFFCWNRMLNTTLRYLNPRHLSWDCPLSKSLLQVSQLQRAAVVLLLALGCEEQKLTPLHFMGGIRGRLGPFVL